MFDRAFDKINFYSNGSLYDLAGGSAYNPPPSGPSYILAEDGSFILAENGDKILEETSS